MGISKFLTTLSTFTRGQHSVKVGTHVCMRSRIHSVRTLAIISLRSYVLPWYRYSRWSLNNAHLNHRYNTWDLCHMTSQTRSLVFSENYILILLHTCCIDSIPQTKCPTYEHVFQPRLHIGCGYKRVGQSITTFHLSQY